jgi:hypothetical protein
MRCANPSCRSDAADLFKGILRLMEFETDPDDRILQASGGFPVCSARTRYFWLCETCSHLFTMKKWNSSGLILETTWDRWSLDSESYEPKKPVSGLGSMSSRLATGNYARHS